MTAVTKVLVVGDIITDIIAVQSGPIAVGSDTPTAISLAGGGSAANTAAWLASLSVPVTLAGVVGADAAGADRLAELTEAGVDCSAIRREPSAVTGSIIVLAQEHERSFLCDRAANSLLAISDVDKAAADEASTLVVMPSRRSACRPAGRHASSNSV